MNNIATQNNYSQSICTCPHCNSTSSIRSGFDRGTQRYCCKSCLNTFKATAGTPVHGLHKKEKIRMYLKALQKGMSVRKAANYVGISNNTSFNWRHKFLSSLQAQSAVRTTSEILTAGLIKLEYSAKGIRKPPERSTSPTKTLALYRDGQLELHKLSAERHTFQAAKIFTENPASFIAASLNKTITASIKRSESAVSIKNKQICRTLIAKAKQQTIKLLNWMERFKGVASKYLQNYWDWYASILNLSQLKQESVYFYRVCISSRSLSLYFDAKNK